MKNNWMKKLSAALCAATLFSSGLAVNVNADGETITKFDVTDFQELTDLKDESGTLTIKKYMAIPDPTTAITEKDKPVNGVEITIKRVGEYATVVDQNGTASVMMGIHKTLFGLLDKAFTDQYLNSPKDNDYVYLTSEQYEKVNEQLQTIDVSKFTNDDVKTYFESDTSIQKTGGEISQGVNNEPGTVKFTIEDEKYGIYLVRETSVSDAVADINDDGQIDPIVKDAEGNNISGEFVAFKKKQYPYLVSIPASIKVKENHEGQTVEVDKWTVNVDANAKNDEVEVDIDKSIERENDAAKFGSVLNQKKTDVTHVGDTVEFTLDSDIPMVDSIQPSDKIDSYEIHDVISNGLSLPSIFDASNIKVMLSGTIPLAMNVHYTIENKNDITKDTSVPEVNNAKYANGQQFTIKFTESGLKELTRVAKDTTEGADERRFVRVSYTAIVNSEAIVGTAGNPNKVKLEYASAGSSEISTSWHEVTEFIFSMEGNKIFDGKEFDKNKDVDKALAVTFEMYLTNPDTDENAKALSFIQKADGSYIYVDPENEDARVTDGKTTTTTLKLDENGKFAVKGIPTTNEESDKELETLYLKEKTTYDGYNKLTNAIPIKLTANNVGSAEYDGRIYTGEVNGKTVQPIMVDGEGVAVDVEVGETGDTSGISFTVNNTKGFQLPSTGGMGIWMFVIGGMAVIGCGLLYYRRNKSAE